MIIKIGMGVFSPSKIFETIFEDNILRDGNIYWGMLTQFVFNNRAELLLLLFKIKPSVIQVDPISMRHVWAAVKRWDSFSNCTGLPYLTFSANLSDNFLDGSSWFLAMFPKWHNRSWSYLTAIVEKQTRFTSFLSIDLPTLSCFQTNV